MSSTGFEIQSIWIAEAASQGQSRMLNKEKVGNDGREFKLSIPFCTDVCVLSVLDGPFKGSFAHDHPFSRSSALTFGRS